MDFSSGKVLDALQSECRLREARLSRPINRERLSHIRDEAKRDFLDLNSWEAHRFNKLVRKFPYSLNAEDMIFEEIDVAQDSETKENTEEWIQVDFLLVTTLKPIETKGSTKSKGKRPNLLED